MSDEAQAPVEQNAEVANMQAELDAMRRKNSELLDEYKKAIAQAKAVPDGVNVDELLEFKRNYEQQQLESQGKYSEARQALEQQFREATAEKDQRISQLEARVRELELVTPAVTALAEIVHDPDMVLKTKLKPEAIEREADGSVVVVDGYKRVPVAEWAKTLPAWMQKQPKPQGSGAPSGGNVGGAVPAGMVNPFNRDSFNLTEQARLYRTDRDLYERLKIASGR
jgi:hypothetical protein